MRPLALLLCLAAWPGTASAATYDLAVDWSDAVVERNT
jgi:hypothetical protein